MSRAQTDGEERLGGLQLCPSAEVPATNEAGFSVQEQKRGTFWDMGVELKFLVGIVHKDGHCCFKIGNHSSLKYTNTVFCSRNGAYFFVAHQI
jgi:hypothetical protein